MKVLVCASEAPLPPFNGLRLQVSALVDELRHSHDVRVLAFLMPDQREAAPDGAVAPGMDLIPRSGAAGVHDSPTLLRAIAKRRPLRADMLAARMRERLHRALDSFEPDVVHVTSGRLAALGPQLAGRPAILAALDAAHRNADARTAAATGLRRVLLRGEARRVRRFERTDYRRFDRVVVVTEEDRDALREIAPALDVTVIGNGVDSEYFSPVPGCRREPGLVVFTGAMHYPPNVEAATFLANRVMPLVRRAVPDARLAIVGRDPAPAVRALEAAGTAEVTGEVPDLRPWLTRANVYACPMVSGTGIKNKLLEAMSAAAACVATPLATQGLRVEPGRDLLVAGDEEPFAAEIVRVLGNDALAERLGSAARDVVRSEHGWSAVARAYEQLYRDVQSAAVPTTTER